MRSALAKSTPTPQPGVRVQLVTKQISSLQRFDGMFGRVVSPDVNLVEELADLGRVSVQLEHTEIFDGAMYLGPHDFTIAAEDSLPGTENSRLLAEQSPLRRVREPRRRLAGRAAACGKEFYLFADLSRDRCGVCRHGEGVQPHDLCPHGWRVACSYATW